MISLIDKQGLPEKYSCNFYLNLFYVADIAGYHLCLQARYRIASIVLQKIYLVL